MTCMFIFLAALPLFAAISLEAQPPLTDFDPLVSAPSKRPPRFDKTRAAFQYVPMFASMSTSERANAGARRWHTVQRSAPTLRQAPPRKRSPNPPGRSTTLGLPLCQCQLRSAVSHAPPHARKPETPACFPCRPSATMVHPCTTSSVQLPTPPKRAHGSFTSTATAGVTTRRPVKSACSAARSACRRPGGRPRSGALAFHWHLHVCGLRT